MDSSSVCLLPAPFQGFIFITLPLVFAHSAELIYRVFGFHGAMVMIHSNDRRRENGLSLSQPVMAEDLPGQNMSWLQLLIRYIGAALHNRPIIDENRRF